MGPPTVTGGSHRSVASMEPRSSRSWAASLRPVHGIRSVISWHTLVVEVITMQAEVVQRLHIRSKTVGSADLVAEILEVRGKEGGPPYLVRYPDEHETVIFPGADCVVEPAN